MKHPVVLNAGQKWFYAKPKVGQMRGINSGDVRNTHHVGQCCRMKGSFLI